MCKFSIIVPVYNVENELSKCIDSILGQSVEDFELILVDDGSTDRSREICDDYGKKDRRIKVIHKSNRGVSSARNSGLDIANGEYIVFVDSDDYVTEDYLEKLYNPNVGMVLEGIKHIKVDRENYIILNNKSSGIFKINEEIINEIIESKYINTVYSKMYHNNIIQKKNIRFREYMIMSEDTMFIIDYMKYIDNIEVKNDLIYNYIKYERETLSTFNEKSMYCLEEVDNYIEQNLLNNYGIKYSESFQKRKWHKYEWTIFQTINSKEMSFTKKRNILKKVFKNKNYIKLVKNIDSYMPNDTQIVRDILSTRSTNLVMLFFFICNLKSRILSSNK